MIILAEELNKDPENLGYADLIKSGNDQAIADLLNQRPESFNPPKTWTVVNPSLPLSKLLIWGATGPLDSINQGLSNTNASIRAACLAALSLLSLPSISTFTPGDPSVATLLGGLVQATILTQNQVNSLISMTNVPASRAEVLLGYGVRATLDDVSSARGNS